jgi:ferrous iron transport protein A
MFNRKHKHSKSCPACVPDTEACSACMPAAEACSTCVPNSTCLPDTCVPTNGSGRHMLAGVAKGCRCRIRRHWAQGAIRQRLLDLGFVPDAEVEMVRCATLGDPLEIRLGQYYVTLRKREADLIEVQEG